jgi:regulator of ribosome biosynthesis
VEVGANDNPYDDPWEKLRDEKRSRVEQNIQSRMKNQEQAGHLMKGATNRVMKDFEQGRKAGKEGGNTARGNVPPSGLPVDLASTSVEAKKRGKDNTVAALKAVQRSTASLGKFDQMREGEPEKRKALAKLKKRKFESATDKKVLSTEGQKSMKILNTVINGGGASKERDIRKGKLAKGETAYDYDFDDGLGASSFRKKKGRAGAGKMKKMTKKRAK